MRDSFDTKSEFPAIATPPPPPMKPNSILRSPSPSPSLRVRRASLLPNMKWILSAAKGRQGREGDVHVQGVQLNCAKQIADKNTFRLSRVRLNEGCLWREGNPNFYPLAHAHTVQKRRRVCYMQRALLESRVAIPFVTRERERGAP